MIDIRNTDVCGFEVAIRGMRNPMNSWGKSDSGYKAITEPPCIAMKFVIGENDLDLMKRLVKSGTDHSKFMRMITVTCDITAPMYWWKEMDTYKVGTVRNSCSTMHTIHKQDFAIDDFSYEHLTPVTKHCLAETVRQLNICRDYLIKKGYKDDWWQIIQLLPSSYNQRATWQANYAVLRNIYHSRKDHKLDEWHSFCAWIELLPYSELITD